MTSDQLAAFDVSQEPATVRAAYGNTPFGRGCLAARRLVEVGVRCVEVTLAGWDSHTNNHETHGRLKAILDPALSALVTDLQTRGLSQRTVVVCGGEFGRTPTINRLAGRDHWTQGFSMALAGGPIRGGQAIGETDREGGRQVVDAKSIGDLHATLLAALRDRSGARADFTRRPAVEAGRRQTDGSTVRLTGRSGGYATICRRWK